MLLKINIKNIYLFRKEQTSRKREASLSNLELRNWNWNWNWTGDRTEINYVAKMIIK